MIGSSNHCSAMKRRGDAGLVYVHYSNLEFPGETLEERSKSLWPISRVEVAESNKILCKQTIAETAMFLRNVGKEDNYQGSK